MENALGGSPDEKRDAYRRVSPLLASEPKSENVRTLIHVPVRLYTEPDVVWWIDHGRRDYYTTNSADQAAMILELRELGNQQAELITTTGKGYRDGKRMPHSWTIVDEADLADWVVKVLRIE